MNVSRAKIHVASKSSVGQAVRSFLSVVLVRPGPMKVAAFPEMENRKMVPLAGGKN